MIARADEARPVPLILVLLEVPAGRRRYLMGCLAVDVMVSRGD